MNKDREPKTGSTILRLLLSCTTLASVFLAGCRGDQERNVSLKALEVFCKDPQNSEVCTFETYGSVGLQAWPHAAIVLFTSDLTVNESHIYLPNAGGDCGFTDTYDPSNYLINTNGGLYYRAVHDTNGDGIADPALTTISENDLTPIPSPIPPRPGHKGTDISVHFLCAENLTTIDQ